MATQETAVNEAVGPALGMAEAAKQLESVMGDAFAGISDHIQWTDGISLDRQLNGRYTAAGAMSESQAETLAGLVNAVVGSVEGGEKSSKEVDSIRIVSVPTKVALEKFGAYGKIFWNDGDRTRTVVFAEDQLKSIKYGLDQLDTVKKGSAEEAAIHRTLDLLIHEMVHALDVKGKSETLTSLKGIAITAGIIASHYAGESEAREAVGRYVANIVPRLNGSKEGKWIGAVLPGLADTIASLFITEGYSAESVQKIVDLLAKSHPEQPTYNIERVVLEEANSVHGRIALAMAAGDIPPEVAKKADKKLDESDENAKGFLLSK